MAYFSVSLFLLGPPAQSMSSQRGVGTGDEDERRTSFPGIFRNSILEKRPKLLRRGLSGGPVPLANASGERTRCLFMKLKRQPRQRSPQSSLATIFPMVYSRCCSSQGENLKDSRPRQEKALVDASILAFCHGRICPHKRSSRMKSSGGRSHR